MAMKRTGGEREFILREETLQKQKLALQEAKRQLAEHKEQLKRLHWMHCPKDGMELRTVSFHGIQIERCPECNGVFLDNRDLEKLASHFERHPQRGAIVRSILNMFVEPKSKKPRAGGARSEGES